MKNTATPSLAVSLAEHLGHVTATAGDAEQMAEFLAHGYARRRAGLEPESSVDKALRRTGAPTCRAWSPVLAAEPVVLAGYCRDRRDRVTKCSRVPKTKTRSCR